ncbi:MAG: glycosyl transferase family protein [Elusimicrobia bacterium]|nr:MAG: glycosyl transferase family protein [Elusimicrobiota bacterium]KAF0157009.1 MAG: glycosyl transferase family protein [Elusimicrobiota bacterium]
MSTLPRLSVLICTRNRREKLGRTLASLLAQEYPAERMDLVLLDDASDDGSAAAADGLLGAFAAAGWRGARLLRNPSRADIARGRERLQGELAGESAYALYLDDDVVLPPGLVSSLISGAERDPSLGVAGPRLCFLSGPDRTAHCANFVGRFTGRYREKDAAVPLDCDWLNSSCLLIRTGALRKSGGFCGSYVTAHEEVDFCLGAGLAGFRVRYFPAVRVLHDIDIKSPKKERLYYLYRNKLWVIRRNFSFPLKALQLAFLLLGGTPLHILDSLRRNGGVDPPELALILKAAVAGAFGPVPRRGRL